VSCANDDLRECIVGKLFKYVPGFLPADFCFATAEKRNSALLCGTSTREARAVYAATREAQTPLTTWATRLNESLTVEKPRSKAKSVVGMVPRGRDRSSSSENVLLKVFNALPKRDKAAVEATDVYS
jgi:hypothetical protein